MRLTSRQLNDIKRKYNVKELWSWSRINAWHTSKYLWKLHYIDKIKPDNDNSIYGEIGGRCHDIIEKLYNGEIEEKDMYEEFDSEWITIRDILEMKFDRNDISKDENISSKYHYDISSFFKNYKKLDVRMKTEQFVPIQISKDIVLQGYIDALYKDKNGIYNIIDWKTSTIYKGEKRNNEAGQLILYAYSLMLKGVPIENIRVCWCFLKYVSVEYKQANGKIKRRTIERSEFGDKMKATVKSKLKKLGLDGEEIENYLIKLCKNNSLDGLPDEVKDSISVNDCYEYVDINEDIINKWIKYVKDTVSEIDETIEKYNETKDDKLFYDSDEHIKKNEYFLSVLSGYSIELNKCYKNYLERKEHESDLLYTVETVNEEPPSKSKKDDFDLDEILKGILDD